MGGACESCCKCECKIFDLQCWKNCNQACLICCGCTCINCWASCKNICNSCSCECDECYCDNPCVPRENSNKQLNGVLKEFIFKCEYDDKWFKEVSLLEHEETKELIIL